MPTVEWKNICVRVRSMPKFVVSDRRQEAISKEKYILLKNLQNNHVHGVGSIFVPLVRTLALSCLARWSCSECQVNRLLIGSKFKIMLIATWWRELSLDQKNFL